MSQPNRTADLRRIAVPALVMHGLHDPLVARAGAWGWPGRSRAPGSWGSPAWVTTCRGRYGRNSPGKSRRWPREANSAGRRPRTGPGERAIRIPNGPGCPPCRRSIAQGGSSHLHRQAGEKRHGVTWVTALVLMVVALPPLIARLAGGYPPNPVPELAALAPLAVVPAVAAVIVAAFAAWWLAVLLAVPAAVLMTWQLPPLRRPRSQARPGPSRGTGSAAATFRLRLFTLNALGGAADPAAVLRILRRHDVDVLAVQELTPAMVDRLAAAGLTQVLPFSHLDARPGPWGTGWWARWPLTPLEPVPGLRSAGPRARIDPPGGLPVTLTAVHPRAPLYPRGAVRRHERRWRYADLWRRELAVIRQTLAAVDGPQVVAGDFNASRDHGPFRELLAAGFLDCADVSQNRSWPGFTWPAEGRALPVMRLDHILVSRTATVSMTRAIRVPRTDHRGVLAVIEFTQET